MATSSPPSKAISQWATPHRAHSGSVPLSNALNFIESLPEPELVQAPMMPEPEVLQTAAREAGITPQQALNAYLIILNGS